MMTPGSRVGGMAVIWTATVAIWFTLLVSEFILTLPGFVLGIVMLVIAGVSTIILIDGKQAVKAATKSATASQRSRTVKAKPKNDQQNSGLDPMSLLTQEDIDELRAEIKAQLRQRLLSGTEGELGSLDALLANQDDAQAHRR